MIRGQEYPVWLTGIISIFSFSLAYSLAYFKANAYPIFLPETTVFVLLLICVLSLPFLVLQKLRLNWLFWAMLLLLTADLTVGLAEKLYRVGRTFPVSRDLTLILSYGIPGLFFAALCYAIRRKAEIICCVFFLVILGSTLIKLPFQKSTLYSVRTNESAASPVQRNPNIFFLILDEHIGIDGIPADVPEGPGLKADLIKHYSQNGFILFPKAFSNYHQSYSSIQSILNQRISLEPEPKAEAAYPQNRVFSKLLEEGYAIQSYQSTWIDFCSAKNIECRKIFSFAHNSMGLAAESSIPLKDKLRILWDGFVFSYRSRLLQTLERFKLHRSTYNMKIGVLATDKMMEELRDDAKRSPAGTLFFAHLSMPHHSYVYDSECRMKPVDQWENRQIIPSDPFSNLKRVRKYEGYFGQVECLHKKLSDLFHAVDQIGIDRSATIILISDHGSRITQQERAEKMRASDYSALFSAFVAIRPGKYNTEFAVNMSNRVDRPIPVARVIAEYFRLAPQSKWEEFDQVYLSEDSGFRPLRMPELTSYAQ